VKNRRQWPIAPLVLCQSRMNRRHFLGALAAASGSLLAPRCFASAAGERSYADNLKRLTDWIVGAMVADGIDLVANMPSGTTHGGRDRADLARLCWLQNCNLYAFHALRKFEPATACKLEKSYRHWYRELFANLDEQTENYLPVGKLPKDAPPAGKYFRVVVKEAKHKGYTIGTETHRRDWVAPIPPDDPRALMKFGVLGAVLRDDLKDAKACFKKALALWDGTGFRTPRREHYNGYYTRNLAYALLCERALRTRLPADLRDAIQKRLWSLQDEDGGLWTNYSRDGSLPRLAKKTTEIGPLTLLAYCDHIWP
jgi:hypothetical protein